jgi:hypothetical protein
MPGVLGQVGQNMADNLLEIGQSAVKGTAKALTDVAHESIEQLSGSIPQGVGSLSSPKPPEENRDISTEQRKLDEKRRFEEVRGELAQYIQWKKRIEQQRISEENAQRSQQVEHNKAVEKKEKESWVSRIINRSQTGTEKGRSSE